MKLCEIPPQFTNIVYDKKSLRKSQKFIKEIRFRYGHFKSGHLVNSEVTAPKDSYSLDPRVAGVILTRQDVILENHWLSLYSINATNSDLFVAVAPPVNSSDGLVIFFPHKVKDVGEINDCLQKYLVEKMMRFIKRRAFLQRNESKITTAVIVLGTAILTAIFTPIGADIIKSYHPKPVIEIFLIDQNREMRGH